MKISESFYNFYGKENTIAFFDVLVKIYPDTTILQITKFMNYHTLPVIEELTERFNLSQGGLWERWKELPEDEQEHYVRFEPNKRKRM
jgi:hypothetical protein